VSDETWVPPVVNHVGVAEKAPAGTAVAATTAKTPPHSATTAAARASSAGRPILVRRVSISMLPLLLSPLWIFSPLEGLRISGADLI
jgi:hypothetical protein